MFFKASTPGTHWWHAHTGMQRADGIYGALTVRQARAVEHNNDTYDYDLPEHKMLLTDWLDSPTLDKFVAHHHSDGNNKPEAFLINGKGKRDAFTDPDSPRTFYTDREVFMVENGSRYIVINISIDLMHTTSQALMRSRSSGLSSHRQKMAGNYLKFSDDDYDQNLHASRLLTSLCKIYSHAYKFACTQVASLMSYA